VRQVELCIIHDWEEFRLIILVEVDKRGVAAVEDIGCKFQFDYQFEGDQQN